MRDREGCRRTESKLQRKGRSIKRSKKSTCVSVVVGATVGLAGAGAPPSIFANPKPAMTEVSLRVESPGTPGRIDWKIEGSADDFRFQAKGIQRDFLAPANGVSRSGFEAASVGLSAKTTAGELLAGSLRGFESSVESHTRSVFSIGPALAPPRIAATPEAEGVGWRKSTSTGMMMAAAGRGRDAEGRAVLGVERRVGDAGGRARMRATWARASEASGSLSIETRGFIADARAGHRAHRQSFSLAAGDRRGRLAFRLGQEREDAGVLRRECGIGLGVVENAFAGSRVEASLDPGAAALRAPVSRARVLVRHTTLAGRVSFSASSNSLTGDRARARGELAIARTLATGATALVAIHAEEGRRAPESTSVDLALLRGTFRASCGVEISARRGRRFGVVVTRRKRGGAGASFALRIAERPGGARRTSVEIALGTSFRDREDESRAKT